MNLSNIYTHINHLSGIDRINSAWTLLKKNVPCEIIGNSYGTTKETIIIIINNLPFTLVKGFTGMYSIGLYHGENQYISVGNINYNKAKNLIIGDYAVRLKTADPKWNHILVSILGKGNTELVSFKSLNTIIVSICGAMGVQMLRLTDQATGQCRLLPEEYNDNVYISPVRLLIDKKSLYEGVGFIPDPEFSQAIKKYIDSIKSLTYGQFLGKDILYPRLADLLIFDLAKAYDLAITYDTLPLPDMCKIISQISNVINKNIYYAYGKYIRYLTGEDITPFVIV